MNYPPYSRDGLNLNIKKVDLRIDGCPYLGS